MADKEICRRAEGDTCISTRSHSLRALAGAVGVSKSQIARDLSTVPSGPPADRVTGLDGKSYPTNLEGQRHTARLALHLRSQGFKQQAIADALGVSQSTVSRCLRDWSYPDEDPR